jgi:hypothetical protein
MLTGVLSTESSPPVKATGAQKAFSGEELGAVTRYPFSGSRIIVERKKREAPSSAGYIPARYSLSELYR